MSEAKYEECQQRLSVLEKDLRHVAELLSQTDSDLSDKAIGLAAEFAVWCKDHIEKTAEVAESSDAEQTAQAKQMEDVAEASMSAAEEWLLDEASASAEPEQDIQAKEKQSGSQQEVTQEAPIAEEQAKKPKTQTEDNIAVPASEEKAKPTKTVADFYERLNKLAYDLQKAIAWRQPEWEKELRKEIRNLPEVDDWSKREKIAMAERFADRLIRMNKRVEKVLQTKRPLDQEVIQLWNEVKTKKKWYKHVFTKKLKYCLIGMCTGILRSKHKEAARTLMERAMSIYGAWVEKSLAPLITAFDEEKPDILEGTEHRIQKLSPAPSWILYIDETKAPKTADDKLRVVGVLVPSPDILPQLDLDFHATELASVTVLQKFNQLLEAPCGIFGLCEHDLHQMTHETWLASVLELIVWVWRLLPIGEENCTFSVCIEENAGYQPDEDLKWLSKALALSLEKESPDRASLITMESDAIRFVKKGTELIGWADVAAFIWGSPRKDIRQGLRKSGLRSTCLLENVKKQLPIWSKALRGEALEGSEWQFLMEQRDRALTEMSLDSLKALCQREPEYWKRYLNATSLYLAGKQYKLDVLERQCAWLAEASTEALSPEMRFFWKLTELANCNHKGIISKKAQQTAEEVRNLAPQVGQISMEAPCHAALRLAVFEANKFNFEAAKNVLSPWNPEAGGKLTGTALWDGKILSSLGQYTAFAGQNAEALTYFTRALESFAKLEDIDAGEASRQTQQTSIYAAIAAMDVSEMPVSERKTFLEKALGKSVESACAEFGRKSYFEDRFSHHALVRYLSEYGTAEEKKLYAKNSSCWAISGIGVDQGHPWPLIQWHRWKMLNDGELRKNVLWSIFQYAWGKDHGVTVEMIGLTLAIASGEVDSSHEFVGSRLKKMFDQLPAATEQIRRLQEARGRNADLVKDVLSFNYR